MAEPTPTVYSYYLPEVRKVVDSLRWDKDFHRKYTENYAPGLDDIHWPLIDVYVDYARQNGVIGLPSYRRYYTNGSSEAIFHLLADHRVNHPAMPIYQLEGEYQGYGQYANTLGLHIADLEAGCNYPNLSPGLIIISQPNARNGNIVEKRYLRKLSENHELIVDLAYLGMTKPIDIDLRDINARAVVGSLSKPFGLYYYRIGFCFSKVDLPSLTAQKWFKNLFSIRVGQAVLENIDHRAIRDNYALAQAQYTAMVNAQRETSIIRPSDVWLMAYSSGKDGEFTRGFGSRYCLTPFFMENEKIAA